MHSIFSDASEREEGHQILIKIARDSEREETKEQEAGSIYSNVKNREKQLNRL